MNNEPTNWAKAACLNANPDIFDSNKPKDIKAAKEFCGKCVIKDACLDDALRLPVHGTRGNLSEDERNTLISKRKRKI